MLQRYLIFWFSLFLGLRFHFLAQCPTHELPGWTLFIDGDFSSILPSPQETDLGEIIEDEDLLLTVRLRGNSCVTTEIVVSSSSGTLLVQDVIPLGGSSN